ncbi:hypothetical protein [Brasilonema bromeliae]|uniref:Actin-like protein N-terminal domain-containing protein n=1 Tax=Brasilonema bromeliae SPC951 TaxID=385972 RepID=A0ABX1P8G2_9CYAN|nr:hypothetical protein [Brasilonema bromeliae]NMG20709.1 hypothetical protein [Brasilonema bromeliae SPC951]
MPRKKVEQLTEDLQETSESQNADEATSDGTVEAQPPKKQSQKEPLRPFLLVADLGRSSCKSLEYFDGQEIEIDKLTSCVARLDSSPGNDYGGFTLELEEVHPTEVNEKGKPVKVKKQEHWVVGDRAQAYPNPIWMTDKSDAKVEYFHILLMGVISVTPNLDKLSTGKSAKQRTLTIDLATLSIAKPDELKKKLKSCKALTINGIKYRLNFTSNQQSFVEGHGGAIHGKNCFPNHNTLYVADLGAGTFQISEFSILNKLPSKKSKDSYHGGGGITSLKREVAKALSNGDSSNYLTRSQVSTILEKSEWTNGKVVAQDFTKSDVSNHITFAINQWLRESPAGFALEDLVNISRRSPVIFCGGGFAIASVKGIIQKQIIESGGDAKNLIFPEDLGLIAVRGVLDYLIQKPSNILQLPTIKEIATDDHDDQAATA